jgi:DNA-binding XRE family transcriptional regulator
MAGGRPTKYKPDHCKVAKAMAKLGATDAEMAAAFGVAVQTLNLWKVTYPEFSASVKLDKAVADGKVVESLYKRAMGYSVTEEDIRVIDGKIVRSEVTRHYPPDPTAMIFWLKNRDKANWRDKHEFEHSGGISVVKIDGTDEAL